MLIDRVKKELFRIKANEYNPDILSRKSYSMEVGLAGYVAVTCHTLFSDKIIDDNRYNVEVDDPQSGKTGQHQAR